jgi:hypothetical protein
MKTATPISLFRVENNSYNQRWSTGGFVIDRPSRKEETEQQAATPPPAKKNDG